MRKKRRGKLLIQIMRPLILFIIVLILTNGIFIFAYNLRSSIDERYNSANVLGQSVAKMVENYQALEFLTEYWKQHSTEMNFYYNQDDQITSREKLIYSILPFFPHFLNTPFSPFFIPTNNYTEIDFNIE